MYYFLIIVVLFIGFSYINKRTFYWENIVKYLWKNIYQICSGMVDWLKKDMSEEEKISIIKNYEKEINVRGNLINAVLDFVNYLSKNKKEDEETYGHGRFSFEKIKNTAIYRPDSFKNIKL